jgi:hypothetical protein
MATAAEDRCGVGVLVIGVTHLNKSAVKAIYRVLDSIAFVAFGRILHLVIQDSEANQSNDSCRLLESSVIVAVKCTSMTARRSSGALANAISRSRTASTRYFHGFRGKWRISTVILPIPAEGSLKSSIAVA